MLASGWIPIDTTWKKLWNGQEGQLSMDAQYNLGCMIEEKLFETAEDAADWFQRAAVQAHDPEIRSKAVFEFTTGGTA